MISSKFQPRFQNVDAHTHAEYCEDYQSGGYHPVHLSDTFKNGTYRVIRKLGYGTASTVWLARDLRHDRYVALKVLTASASKDSEELSILRHLAVAGSNHPGYENVVKLLDAFDHSGPNGTHLCIVLEAMGSSAVTMIETFKDSKYPKSVAREISKQIMMGLNYLHQNGITHGDIQPENFLFSIPDLSLLSEDELTKGLKEPIVVPVIWLEGKKVDDTAPKYLTTNQPLTGMVSIRRGSGTLIKLADMGGAFWSHNRVRAPVMPLALRAPELIVGGEWNQSIDIWNIGCIIFELITSVPLFALVAYNQEPDDVDNDEHLQQLTEIIGKLPDYLACKWERLGNFYGPDGTCLTNRTSIEPPLEEYFNQRKPAKFTDIETRAFISLLRSMLCYDPSERLTSAQVLKHPWFVAGGWDT